jgi:hypothetical protein
MKIQKGARAVATFEEFDCAGVIHRNQYSAAVEKS